MPGKLGQSVKPIVFAADLSHLHPYDWMRFYDIIHHAHRYRIKMRPEDLAKELAARGVAAKMVAELAHLYDFGRSLLARHFTWER